MRIEQYIEDLIAPVLLDKGFRVVRIQLQGVKKKTLQVMIESVKEESITLDDCALVSRAVSVLLDVEDPIHEPYTLEVSSPGLDRPLVKKMDFERFVGSKVKIELNTPYEGRLRFQGTLKGVDKEMIKIELDVEKKVVEFDFCSIKKAKLIPDYEIPRLK